MRIAEIYRSVQGEGLLTETPSVFVRTSGCNLRCRFCDTPFASWEPEGKDLAVDDIVREVLSHDLQHVVLTGGEPMLFAELIPLCSRLDDEGLHITVETAGTLHLQLPCDLMSVSPKLANSAPDATQHSAWFHRHEATRHQPLVIARLLADYPCQFKFVIQTPADVDEVERWMEEIQGVQMTQPTSARRLKRSQVLLMPEGVDLESLNSIGAWLKPTAESRGFGYCPRRQIEWFGNRRRT